MPRPTPGTRGRSPRRVQTATCLLFLPHGRGAGAGQAVARRDGPSPPGPDFRGEPVSCIPANDGHPWPSERSAGRPRGTDGRTIGSTGRGGSREGRGHRSHRQRGDKRRPRPCGAPAVKDVLGIARRLPAPGSSRAAGHHGTPLPGPAHRRRCRGLPGRGTTRRTRTLQPGRRPGAGHPGRSPTARCADRSEALRSGTCRPGRSMAPARGPRRPGAAGRGVATAAP